MAPGWHCASTLRSPSQKERVIVVDMVCTGNYYHRKLLPSYDFNTGCVDARAMRVGRGFLETCPQKAAVQFLSEMARSASCLWITLVFLHSVTANLVSVVGPIYNLFIAVF